jgi:hypothetical protein
VPERLLPLRVEALHIGDYRVSVDVSRAGWRIEGLPPSMRLIRRPRSPLPVH